MVLQKIEAARADRAGTTLPARVSPASSSELYPVPSEPELTRWMFGRSRRNRDATGHMLIPEPLTALERQTVESRLRALAGPLAPAKRGEIAAAVRETFAGFLALEGDAGAAAVVAQYVVTLKGLPLFAIRRACLRFAQGYVTAEELGEKTISNRGRPNTAQLRIVAEAVVRPHWDEASCASLLLGARVEPPEPTPEERARTAAAIEAKHAELTARLAQSNLEEGQRELADRERARTTAGRRDREAREAEYRARGLEPVYADPARTIVVSLPMMLASGATIEEVDGVPTLVRPAGGGTAAEPRRESA